MKDNLVLAALAIAAALFLPQAWLKHHSDVAILGCIILAILLGVWRRGK